MWKAVRPGCSLNVPIWNVAEKRGCLLPVLFAHGQLAARSRNGSSDLEFF